MKFKTAWKTFKDKYSILLILTISLGVMFSAFAIGLTMLNNDYRHYSHSLILLSSVTTGLIIAIAKCDDKYRVFIDKGIRGGVFLMFLSLFLFTSL